MITQLKSSSDVFRSVFDICVPKSCKGEDIISFWGKLSGGYELPINVTINEEHCHYKNKPIGVNSTDIFVL